MGKLLISFITSGEEQILSKIKDFLAKGPGIEVMEPPAVRYALTIPDLELHLRKQTIKRQGQLPHLAHLEFSTLAYLAQYSNWIFTQEQIYETAQHEFPEDCGAITVNIVSQLRRKMGPGNPIHTISHSGYRFELPSADQVCGKEQVQQSVQIDCHLSERKWAGDTGL